VHVSEYKITVLNFNPNNSRNFHMKKILVVGGHGCIGKAVIKALQPRHEIIVANRSSGDVRVDITDKNSIQAMYATIGKIDAVIAAAGKVHFAPLTQMTDELYALGLNNKLMGQVNLVLCGLNYLKDGGSFTLTSGILNREPVRGASAAAMANGALDSFVRVAAVDLPRALRINIVSPTILAEADSRYGDIFLGFEPIPADRAAQAYVKSVEGAQTGQIYIVG
jgi:NAD(P)-dependent dehydrogenase (short-subunit alcohol dehydrogenase family)